MMTTKGKYTHKRLKSKRENSNLFDENSTKQVLVEAAENFTAPGNRNFDFK